MSPANDNQAGGASQAGGSSPTDDTPRPCPICGRPAIRDMRPFCSKRCADVDLHRWLGGRYAVPVETSNGDEDVDT